MLHSDNKYYILMVTFTTVDGKIAYMKKLGTRALTPSIMGVLIKEDSTDGVRRRAFGLGYELSENLAKRILYMKRFSASVDDGEFPIHFSSFEFGEAEYSNPFEEE